MKKILRFQLKDLTYSCLAYALVMLLLYCVPLVISITFGDIDVGINGNGLPGAVFCLVFGIAVYKEHLLMAVQYCRLCMRVDRFAYPLSWCPVGSRLFRKQQF